MTAFPLTRLGLPAPITPAGALPEGIDGTAITAALHQAIDTLTADLRLDPARALLPGQALRIVAAAAKSLLESKIHLHEAVWLTEQAGPDLTDSAALAHIRLIALAQSGERILLIAEINRLLALEPVNLRLQEIVQNFVTARHLLGGIAPRASNHRWLWGEIPQDLGHFIRSLQPGPTLPGVAPKLMDFLGGLRTEVDQTTEEFRTRIGWGFSVQRYLMFINQSARMVRSTPPQGRALSSDEVKVMALFKQIDSVLLPPDLTLLEQARDAGLSLVILDAHAGVSLLSSLGQDRLDLPRTVISFRAEHSADPRNFNIATGSNDVQTQVLKLTKLLKKQQRLVRLAPDGAEGEPLTFELCGRTIKLGQGAAMLAYHGRAAMFFACSHWNGSAFQISFLPGPVATDAEPREVFERAFYDFYLGCLRQIVTGPPEDMAPNGGFWRLLS